MCTFSALPVKDGMGEVTCDAHSAPAKHTLFWMSDKWNSGRFKLIIPLKYIISFFFWIAIHIIIDQRHKSFFTSISGPMPGAPWGGKVTLKMEPYKDDE